MKDRNRNRSCTFAMLSVLGLGAAGAQAAELDIQWMDPEEYRDIEAANMSQERFEKRVIEELSEHFEDAAQRLLPENYTLAVDVSDVDLAGDIEYFISPYGQPMRVVRDLYFPRLTFAYELRDAEGEVIASGKEEVTDKNFYVFSEWIRDDPLFYEKQMIDDWFYDTFYEQISS